MLLKRRMAVAGGAGFCYPLEPKAPSNFDFATLRKTPKLAPTNLTWDMAARCGASLYMRFA